MRVEVRVDVKVFDALLRGLDGHDLEGALRERHIVGPRVLKDSSWELHLTMAESGGGVSRKDPTAIFDSLRI